MRKDDFKVLINGYLEGNKLTCHRAFDLHEKTGLPLKEIGEIANELKIKISDCQLGCFK